jgi:hypothetical protein
MSEKVTSLQLSDTQAVPVAPIVKEKTWNNSKFSVRLIAKSESVSNCLDV